MHRRHLLAGFAGIAAWPQLAVAGGRGRDRADDIEADIAASVTAELVAFDGRRARGTRTPLTESMTSAGRDYMQHVPQLDEATQQALATGSRYWRLEAEQRPPARVLSADRHPDTWHLRDYDAPADDGFEVDAALLTALAEANAFPMSDAPIRLFGLRGATLLHGEASTDWGPRHALQRAEPDHVERRCVIGTWRTADDQIRLFSASTVPQIANMFAVLRTQGWGASLLPTGQYTYVSGTHNRSTSRPQPGALRNASTYVSLRATLATGDPKSIAYDPWDPYNAWTYGSAHNIHAGGSGRHFPRFDSAGCQVIQGGYNKTRTAGWGAWRTFQHSAGLVDDDGAAGEEGRAYTYMLLTGRDAWLRYHADAGFVRDYQRLRPGSQGPRVQAMRTELAAAHPQILGTDTPAPGPEFDAMTAFLVLHAYRADPNVQEHVGVVWPR